MSILNYRLQLHERREQIRLDIQKAKLRAHASGERLRLMNLQRIRGKEWAAEVERRRSIDDELRRLRALLQSTQAEVAKVNVKIGKMKEEACVSFSDCFIEVARERLTKEQCDEIAVEARNRFATIYALEEVE